MSERPFARRVVSEKALTTRASGLRFTRRAVVRERSWQVMASATDDLNDAAGDERTQCTNDSSRREPSLGRYGPN